MAATSQNGASTPEAHAGELFAGILQSPAFVKAPSLRQLLTFLWDHRNDAISEYTLATEALGRPSSFDPRADATVRVVVARLRQRLKDYYASEGADCPLRLSIPLGGHQLAVELRLPEPVAEQAEPEPAPVPPARPFPWIPVALAMAAAACGLLIGQFLPRRGETRPALPPFWAGFFKGGKPTSVYVPTPVFVSWADSPVMRDVRINDPQKMLESTEIAALAKRLGPPQITRSYAVGPDTFAAVKLVQFLATRGVHVQLEGTGSMGSSAPQDRNVVLPGTSWSSSGVRAATQGANFQLSVEDSDVIVNLAPKAGEPAEYRARRISPARSVQYGTILHRTTSPVTRQLALAGVDTEVLVGFLTAEGQLDELDQAWQQAGRPPDFEALVEAETEGETALRTHLVAFRALPASR
ncbi:MAG: hypothetical protein J0H49_27080 [Acidobacteria bacterium]|nr:hypothetical protein [Acidobacteriota bacterium]